jgi:hypothetical protein
MIDFRRFIPSVSSITDRLPSADGVSSLNHKMWVVVEQLCLAFLAACATGYPLNFAPWYVGLGWLIIAGLFVGIDAWRTKKLANYRVATVGYLVMSLFYYSLGQPFFPLVSAGVFGLFGGVIAARRFGGAVGAKIGLFVVGTILGAIFSAGLYALLLDVVLPWVHPFMIKVWNIAPALVQLPMLAVFGYCAVRQPKDHASKFWFVYPAMSALFLLFFWPSHSYIAQAVGVIFAMTLSVYAYIGRFTGAPRDDTQSSAGLVGKTLGLLKPRRQSHCALALATAGSIVFTGLFYVTNTSQGIVDYQMANAVSVTRTTELPVSSETAFRLVPYVAATDYCASGNGAQFSQLQESAQPVILPDEQGNLRYYWICGRYPKRFQFDLGHLIYATGGMEGAIMVKAGERGIDTVPMNTDFVFSDLSVWARGAFFARHPVSTPLGAIPYHTAHGDVILVPYVSKVLQWGSMVPEASGVMVLSPLGFFQDYLPIQAEHMFPGARINPADMARQYAELWGHSRSVYQTHLGGDLFEVSEFASDAATKEHGYPFWSMYKDLGMKGFIPFEPFGKQQNIIAQIGLFDNDKLEMTVVDVSRLNLAGPRKFLARLQTIHPGLFNSKLIEAQGFFTPDHKIFWLLALVNPSVNDNHGYASNVIVDCKGEETADVKSGDELLAWVKAWSEKHPNDCK